MCKDPNDEWVYHCVIKTLICQMNYSIKFIMDIAIWMCKRLYQRTKCGSSNSTSTSRTSLQKGEPWEKREVKDFKIL